MPREIESDGVNLIFKDYQNREVTIKHEDYLGLMESEERRLIRPALEDFLADPTEVWWSVENIENKDYTYYKYFKIYKDLVFIAYVVDPYNEYKSMIINTILFISIIKKCFKLQENSYF